MLNIEDIKLRVIELGQELHGWRVSTYENLKRKHRELEKIDKRVKILEEYQLKQIITQDLFEDQLRSLFAQSGRDFDEEYKAKGKEIFGDNQ